MEDKLSDLNKNLFGGQDGFQEDSSTDEEDTSGESWNKTSAEAKNRNLNFRTEASGTRQKQNFGGSSIQPRVFYDGEETKGHERFQALSHQKSRDFRYFKKDSVHTRGKRRSYRTRGNFQLNKPRNIVTKKTAAEYYCKSKSLFNVSSEIPNSNISQSSEYKLEYFPNTVNINQKQSNSNTELDRRSSCDNTLFDSDLNDDCEGGRVSVFLKAKEDFYSMKSNISPEEIIIDYRRQIQKMCEKCTDQNFANIKRISPLIVEGETYASIFKLHYANLTMQQEQFDTYISRKKNECTVTHDNDVDTVIRRADRIKMHVRKECNLFQRTLPAYAYKNKILSALEKNNVVLVSSDCSYFFNIVLPIIITSDESPKCLSISCETNNLSCDWVKNEINNILKNVDDGAMQIKILTEDFILNDLKHNILSENCCFIFNLPLKRSVTSDLLLSIIKDVLYSQKHFKLILLLSIFDDVKKFQKYFSDQKVFTLEVPKLLLPIQTVWKKESLLVSTNYKENVVSTALAIHFLNETGDVYAFLPNLADAKIAVAMFTSRITELNCDNVECILLHENSCNVTDFKNNADKRRIFFTTSCAEALPLPSVRYVIDSGLARDFMFDSVKNLDVLTVKFNSRAKCRLRKSLVGVYQNGICYRIYNKDNFCTDMTSYELPELLTLNPFNSLIKIFHYQPKKALSVQFVEPLNDVLKHNTMILLKNFYAVKNGKLTELGEKMVKLPYPARYSKLLWQSIQWGFAYEAVILVAFFSVDSYLFKVPKNEDYQQKVDAAKLELIQHESDALTFLHVYKCWTENKFSDVWCDRHYIMYDTLIEIKNKIGEICCVIDECWNETICQNFSEVGDAGLSILEMLFDCFSDNLCVYSGHYRGGYRILSSRQTAFLHPSSILTNKENMPQLIIFNKVGQTSRNFLFGVTAVPEEMVLTSLSEKKLDYDYSDVFERSLVCSVIEPVSERIIKQVLLGPKGKRLQEIEDSMKEKLKSDFIIVDPSAEKGCVNIFALQPVLDSAVKMVNDILKSNLEDVINAEAVYDLEFKRGHITVPLEVKCMMGAKITSVKIKNISQDSNSNQKSLSSAKTFKDNSSSVQYSINLTWIRRPCNGICFVDFPLQSFTQARRLACKNLIVLESEIYVEVSKMSENQLILTDVPRDAKANDIEKALMKYLPNVKIDKIELKYTKAFETTLKDIEDIKMQIMEYCEEYTDLVDYDIVIPKPKNSATIMTAYINVFGSEDLTTASENLSNFMIHNFKLNAIPVYRSIIKSSYKVYMALEKRIQKQIEKLKHDLSEIFPDKNLFRLEAQKINADLVLIKILSNDIKIMKHLQKAIHELLEGEMLTKSLVKDINKLFCHGGYMWLRTLEKYKKVYIIEDYNSKVIRVYGSLENCFSVKECILQFLEDTENEAVETIVLSRGHNSRILLKSIIKEYGVELKSFVERCQLRSAVLDIKSCRLFLHGSRDSIELAKDILNMLSNNLDSTEECSLLSGGDMCPVCACPAFNLTFRLQHCGHLYCNECISGLVEQAEFPIQCCAENCSEDIVLEDIVRILNEDEEKIKKLLHASLKDYLEKNHSEIFYCPAPDCPMFTFKNEISEKWMCPLCQNEICTNCNVVFHIGFTCDVYQGSKKDPDYSFKVWKQGATECKQCPKCNIPIEKNQGCDHMTCTSCKAHFCWVCVREFPSDTAVYNHIPFCDKYPKW